jgi:exopolysaccharide biosynthesis polyprenyl glycosylphosphotransferase
MLKQQGRILAVATFLLDVALVALAFFLAYWLRNALLPFLARPIFPGHLYPLRLYLPLLPLALLIWGSLFLVSGRYRSHRTVRLPEEVWAIIKVCGSGAVIFTLTLYALRLDDVLLPNDYVSRVWILLFPVLACLLLVAEKLAIRLTLRSARSWGLNYRTVLIVGTSSSAYQVAQSIDDHRFWGFRVVGFVASGAACAEPPPPGREILGAIADMPQILQRIVVDDVIFSVGRGDLDRLEDLYLMLQEQGIRVRFALNLFPHTQAKVELEDLDGVPMLTFESGPSSLAQLLAKRAMDIAVSAVLMLVGFPVAVGIALLIKISSGGAVLYRQTRCGLNGRSFTLYKFRTMVEDAHERRSELMHLNEMDGPVFKLRNDPRVTFIGRFLRKFSLDELPQLWNVLRGDMSLVGPRPPIPEEVKLYQRWQRRRLSMKPGLTCLWQISGRNEVDFDRWIELDLQYIDSWTPLLDLKIMLKTIPVVLTGRGAS